MMRLRLPIVVPSVSISAQLEIAFTSSAVAVSGDRFRKAANRLQLEMWLRWEWRTELAGNACRRSCADAAG